MEAEQPADRDCSVETRMDVPAEEAEQDREEDVLYDFPPDDDGDEDGTLPLHHLNNLFPAEVMKLMGQPVLEPSQDSHQLSRQRLFEAKTKISSADSAE